MNTNTAKAIAEKRHLFMDQYLTCFMEEWNVENTSCIKESRSN